MGNTLSTIRNDNSNYSKVSSPANVANHNSNYNNVSGSANVANNNPSINVFSSPGTTINYNAVNHFNPPPPKESDVIQIKIVEALKERYVSNATYDAQPGEGCMEGTRLQILSDIETWILSPKGQQIFWLDGWSGTGKTAIAQTVCSRIRAHAKIMLGGSFFCSRSTGSIQQRDVRCVIPTLAQLMARQSPEFSKALAVELAHDPDILEKKVSTQVDRLLHAPLLALRNSLEKSSTTIVFVIDALDECGSRETADETANNTEIHRIVSEMLEALVKFSRSNAMLPVKFLVTSRPETHIRDTPISNDTFSAVLHLQTVKKEQVTEDIRLYISARLSSSSRLRFLFTDDNVDMLVKLCDGLFIVATTALQYALGKGVDLAPSRFKTLFNTTRDGLSNKAAEPLDHMYRLIMMDAARVDHTDADELKATLHLLASILSARTPLSVVTLSSLLSMDKDDARVRLARLHAVVYVSDDDADPSLRTLHASFGDYLASRAPSDIRVSASFGHNVLAHGCLRVMVERLHFNISQSQSSYEPNPATRPEAINSSLEYACLQWIYHVVATTVPSEFYASIYAFIRSRFLFWLEVFSVLGQATRAPGILLFAATEIDFLELSECLRDAHAFVAASLEPIMQSAPHIYLSALPFAAKDSFVYQTYYPRCIGLISVEAFGVNRQGASFIQALIGHMGWVTSVDYSPDGRLIASGSDEGTVLIWDARTGNNTIPPLSSGGVVTSVAFSPDGKNVAAGTTCGHICIWNLLASPATLQRLCGHQRPVQSIAFSPDGMRFASSANDPNIRLWNFKTGSLIVALKKALLGYEGVTFSPDGTILVGRSYTGSIDMWHAATGKPAGSLESMLMGKSKSICISPDGSILAAAGFGRTVLIYDLSSGKVDVQLSSPYGRIYRIQFLPDGRLIVLSKEFPNAFIWIVQPRANQVPILLVQSLWHNLRSTCISPDGLHFASVSGDRAVWVWEVIQRQQLAPLTSEGGLSMRSIAVSSDGKFIVTASGDHAVSVWDLQTRQKRLNPFRGHTSAVRSVSISPNMKLIASASADRTIRLWSTQTWDAAGDPLIGHTATVHAVVFSPDSRCVVTGSLDGTVREWDVTTGQQSTFSPLRCSGGVHTVAFSPDARVFAAGDDTGRIYVWEADTGKLKFEPIRPGKTTIYSIGFSPDGTRLVAGGSSGDLRIWNTSTSERLQRLVHSSLFERLMFLVFSNQVTSVAYSCDGRYICSASNKAGIQQWDTATGQLINKFDKKTRIIGSVGLSGGGLSMVSVDRETIRVWDLTTPPDQSSTSGRGQRTALEYAKLNRGWLVGQSGELLLWVPVEYRKYLPGFPCTAVIGENGEHVTIRSNGCNQGETWTRCWTENEDSLAS